MGSLAPDAVEPLLAGRLGRPYVYRDRCDSTQLLLDPGLPEGATAVCDEQIAGRGRLGRAWAAPAGTAILCSVLLRPPEGRRIQELSLVGANAVADAVEHELKLAVQIKWPNDVMLNRYKIAGVLGEAKDGAVVLGVGLNVNQTRDQLPQDARLQAGSLRSIDTRVHDRAQILTSLLLALERNYDRWLDGGLDAVYGPIGARDFLRGRHATVDGTSGLVVGIDRAGRLELDTADGQRFVESGEVVYER